MGLFGLISGVKKKFKEQQHKTREARFKEALIKNKELREEAKLSRQTLKLNKENKSYKREINPVLFKIGDNIKGNFQKAHKESKTNNIFTSSDNSAPYWLQQDKKKKGSSDNSAPYWLQQDKKKKGSSDNSAPYWLQQDKKKKGSDNRPYWLK